MAETHKHRLSMSDVLATAPAFRKRLEDAKAVITDVQWYPYDSIMMIDTLKGLTSGMEIPVGSVLDIGAADGDMALLFACAGSEVHAIDHPNTNFNHGQGLRRLNDVFNSNVLLTFTDVDFGFTLPRQYDFCLAAGIAYHLRNLPLFYITLAEHSQMMITNTRVIDDTPGSWFKRKRIGDLPLAYFVDTAELNNDPTNFWLLTPAAFRRVLKRSGWRILREFVSGATRGRLDDNKRMWALCERVSNYGQLRQHHHF